MSIIQINNVEMKDFILFKWIMIKIEQMDEHDDK